LAVTIRLYMAAARLPPRSEGAHSALVPVTEIVVRYPFHPLIGRSFVVAGQYEHYGAPHVLVRGSDGATYLLPAWMTTAEAGAMAIVACPRLPVNTLLELREFLDGLASTLPSGRHVRGGDGDEGAKDQTTRTVRRNHSSTRTADATQGGSPGAVGHPARRGGCRLRRGTGDATDGGRR